jgi:hypothetical protein
VATNDDTVGATRPDLASYAQLISSFVSRRLTGPEFETAYLTLFKNDPVRHGERAFLILDRLFADVDEYFDDPDFNDQQRIQAEEDLRDRAQEALTKLINVPN